MKAYHTPVADLIVCSFEDVIRTSGGTELFGSAFENVVDWGELS